MCHELVTQQEIAVSILSAWLWATLLKMENYPSVQFLSQEAITFVFVILKKKGIDIMCICISSYILNDIFNKYAYPGDFHISTYSWLITVQSTIMKTTCIAECVTAVLFPCVVF